MKNEPPFMLNEAYTLQPMENSFDDVFDLADCINMTEFFKKEINEEYKGREASKVQDDLSERGFTGIIFKKVAEKRLYVIANDMSLEEQCGHKNKQQANNIYRSFHH